ncbi:GNAT family N-acetyltransferase [Paenibacillus sp. KN14-4R]|uniref:GNAT family N-acetyltransferase n=1 Tax=Paenibacillus sp. KN14-4R TaxID=3445773 RepID=UPI003FA0BF24
MIDVVHIEEVQDLLLYDLSEIIEDSIQDGHRHISRLMEEYRNGVNRFNQPDEALFLARADEKIVGICGLNRDPFGVDVKRVGRIRRLYVLADYRRYGIGQLLVETVILKAKGKFETLTLRTDHPIASRFYEALGFEEVTDLVNITHMKRLN